MRTDIQGTVDVAECRQFLEDAWLVMLMAAALAIAAPWFLRTLPIDIGTVSWAMFVYGVVSLAASRLLDRLRGARSMLAALTLLQALGIVFLAGVWHLAGNIQNPMFLMAFGIPIAAAGYALPGWRALGLAGIAVVAVATVALGNAPELRWYVTQLGVPASLLPPGSFALPRPYPGMDVPAASLFLTLVTFASLTLGLSLVAHAVALTARRQQLRLDAASRAAGDAHALAADVIRVMPTPCVLLYPDTLRIARASASFVQRVGQLPEQLAEQPFLEVATFSFPEVLLEAIARGSGDIPFAVYRAGGVASAARVRVSAVEHAGDDYVLVVIEDVAERFALGAAMEAVTRAVVVIDDDDRVRYFNPAAQEVLPSLAVGAHAATPLAQPDGGGWWRLGDRDRRERQVQLGGRSFDARCVAAHAPGRQDRLTVVELSRVAA